MNLLLDTHVFLWFVRADDRLPPEVAERIKHSDSTSWISAVTVWEAILLAERGRIAGPGPFAAWLRHELSTGPFREAPITWEIARESRAVPLPHGDPADRFLAATAIVQGYTLVTADRTLHGIPGLDVLRVDGRRPRGRGRRGSAKSSN